MDASELIDRLTIAVQMFGDGPVVGQREDGYPYEVRNLQTEMHEDGYITHWLKIAQL